MRYRLLALAMMMAGAAPAQSPRSAPVPPGFTMARTGATDDFAYFEGAWETRQHRLVMQGERKGQWEDFPGTLCANRHLGGLITVDELYFPETRTGGFTLRTFDPKARQWSIYWVSGATGRLDPIPTVGGFQGSRGEFYARDTVGGRAVKVRYLWTLHDHDHARWEQAFSFDDQSWETNWTADFTRADPAAACENGRPRR